jgi:integrase
MARGSSARPRQARALTWGELEPFTRLTELTPRYLRDRALVCVAYDTLCRREELVRLRAEDLERHRDGSATVLIRRSKTDPSGEGAAAYLSPATRRHLEAWLACANIADGVLFRRLTRRGPAAEALAPAAVTLVYKRIARWLGLPEPAIAQISGHSTRVGAAQDLLALNIDLASVMQAGRWIDTRMPMRYGEHVLAQRGAMARAAAQQGRT